MTGRWTLTSMRPTSPTERRLNARNVRQHGGGVADGAGAEAIHQNFHDTPSDIAILPICVVIPCMQMISGTPRNDKIQC